MPAGRCPFRGKWWFPTPEPSVTGKLGGRSARQLLAPGGTNLILSGDPNGLPDFSALYLADFVSAKQSIASPQVTEAVGGLVGRLSRAMDRLGHLSYAGVSTRLNIGITGNYDEHLFLRAERRVRRHAGWPTQNGPAVHTLTGILMVVSHPASF